MEIKDFKKYVTQLQTAAINAKAQNYNYITVEFNGKKPPKFPSGKYLGMVSDTTEGYAVKCHTILKWCDWALKEIGDNYE